MNLPWKYCWITGAGRGIGRALAQRLAEEGITVYASARTQSELESLQQDCAHCSGAIIPQPVDITQQEQINALWEHWREQLALPDLVVLNAGTHKPVSAEAFSAEACAKLWQVNLQGTVNCLEPALQQMLSNGAGQIAVMASVAGYRGLPTASIYGASKAALINLCEALRLDLADSGIKLQLINPGFVRTPLTDLNSFEMPCLLEPDVAAGRILKGLLSSQFEITFPKRFTYVLKCLRLLPYRLYFALIGRMIVTD
ncbi:SDR family NAD(P)-dependent oxidoreductase [Neptuniibacter sp. CAU 1671]|uniref:SDR family NAD(P)-dependent oxidoreductase n=1 Tax=Neptuniibacter sp. CAU 1671 TaxID=3032593 RepID=UPI0023DCD992|nr:SDR family NAD(P)-dependent oxidoreductase [Neptuniibacter sp. CAU 1671]MDF2182831.1 SDR family NAD(P)-dependent oxidoreductase [Neptuniibacter sp. CAU 1671]